MVREGASGRRVEVPPVEQGEERFVQRDRNIRKKE